eukprot:CAMPEP_0176179770 /NCGR_PEP_ID=MMETSP0120_2-20121206/92108_1 /TAXON_ID=160619 /ORGANISM="Kryptoperidinium foliaceum, Strain CCMP 1326" /LENGTH=37 /DNA_ID= /DNA_START= /DNA_END= /DNA_ORIENTATION=
MSSEDLLFSGSPTSDLGSVEPRAMPPPRRSARGNTAP